MVRRILGLRRPDDEPVGDDVERVERLERLERKLVYLEARLGLIQKRN